ncbi:leucine-rich repeat-containing protein [Gigaspora margarita]|uniref:Leucine-rich repeat-containing protein n=1 Tax=Gigaspora margarita TaxID=4874 RepID=A0A8H4APK2_GIGMA|nr:leucine-rich repeat-containing protein [Gigaspora margarita]
MLNEDVDLENDILGDYASETSILNQENSVTEVLHKETLDTKNHFKTSSNITDPLEEVSENDNNNKTTITDVNQLIVELEKIKEERQQLVEENLGLQGDLKEFEGERDKLIGLIGVMKVEWEKQYQKLQSEFQESNINRNSLESQLSELRLEYDKLKKTSSKVEEITDRLHEVENQKSALSKIFEDQQNGVQMLMKGMAAEREEWQQREAKFIENQTSINNTLKKYESEVKTLKQELNATLADKQTMKQKLIEVGKEKMSVDVRIRELESEKKKFGGKLEKLIDEKGKLSSQLTDSKKILEKNKLQISTLAKKLAAADVEQQKLVQTFEKSMTQSEKTCENLRNKLRTLQKEKDKLIQGNIGSLKNDETDVPFETDDKRSSDNVVTEVLNDKDNTDVTKSKSLTLEQRIIELENSLKLSKSECARLNEKLAQVQVGYLNAVNDKDQLALSKRESDKKVKALEAQLESVLERNMELIIQMSTK